MSDNTSLGNRIKGYEAKASSQFFRTLPVLARLDGRSFHRFTHGLPRPYDNRLSALMTETAQFLVAETNACCGYTQSDEISLVWQTPRHDSELFFDGKLQKMCSVLASLGTAFFNRRLPDCLPEKKGELPVFDCRVFQVPSETEAANCFIWRELDATRNSVQMAARARFSHNECENKNTSELHDMLFEVGINWNDYPTFFKRGSYLRRRAFDRPFTPDELAALPPKHHARTNAGLVVKRTAVVAEEFPPLRRVKNREDVILRGAEPVLAQEVAPAST